MIVVDVDILIDAVNRDAPLRTKAKAWLENTLWGGLPGQFYWLC